jgi:hypothetical protein
MGSVLDAFLQGTAEMGVFAWIFGLNRRPRAVHPKRSRRGTQSRWDRESLAPHLHVRRLEERRVLNADAAPVQQLVVDAGAAAGDGQADTFIVDQRDNQLSISVNGQEVARAEANQLDSIRIKGSADDDLLIAEFKSGEPLAAMSLLFEGNDGADTLTLRGDTAASDVSYSFGEGGANHVGVESSNGDAMIAFSGVESVQDQLTAATRDFRFESGGQEITLKDAGTADDDVSRLDVKDSFQQSQLSVIFKNPTESLSIDTKDATETRDSLTLAGLDDNYRADLHVIGSPDDLLTVRGPTDLGGGDLNVLTGAVNVESSLTTTHAEFTLRASSEVLVTEAGLLTNDAGSISLEAPSINHNGFLVAHGGQIQLDSGAEGTTIVRGTIDVSGEAEVNAGSVYVLGNHVGLFDDAQINATALVGGGTILIGGDYQGKNAAVRNAARTYVGPNTVIRADAITGGSGGKVIVWADEVTRFYGTITARGGSQSGDGGFAEVSGKTVLDFLGSADLSAQAGSVGQLLLDPGTLNIGANASDNGFLNAPGDSIIAFNEGGAGTTRDITAAHLVAQLALADITLQANTEINFLLPIVSLAANDLVLDAPTINFGTGTGISLAGGNLIFGVTEAGNVVLNDSVVLSTGGGNVVFSGTINADNAAANNRTLTVTAGTGTVAFEGAIGNTQELADLDVTAAAIDLNSTLVKVDDQGGNTVTFTGPVVLTANVTIDTDGAADNSVLFDTAASTINADNALANNRTLTVTAGTGTVAFEGSIGNTQALADLDVTAATIDLNSPLVKIDDQGGNTVTFTGPVVLTDNVTIDTDGAADNSVLFDTAASTINADNAAANNRTLTMTAGTGTVAFEGSIGNTQELADLDVTAAAIDLNSPTVRVDDGPGGATVTFDGPVVLTDNVLIDTDGTNDNNVLFTSTINADNALANNRTLTVTAGAGTVAFEGAIGNTQELADLDVTAAAIDLNSTLVKVDDQGGNTVTFTGPVVLTANVTIDTDGAADNSVLFDTAASTINADNALTNNRTLTMTAGAGTVAFEGSIGNN